MGKQSTSSGLFRDVVGKTQASAVFVFRANPKQKMCVNLAKKGPIFAKLLRVKNSDFASNSPILQPILNTTPEG